MASLRGLYAFAKANNALGEALIVTVGLDSNGAPVRRCMVAELAPNILARAAGEGNVPQVRFVCDGFCGLTPKRPTKACRAVDRAAVPTQAVQPPGLVGIGQTRIATPYRIGGGGAGAGQLALPAPGQTLFGAP